MSDNYSSPYICYCSKTECIRGICINWRNEKVIGYDCHYPNCKHDCQLFQQYHVGFTRLYQSEDQT